MTRTRHIIAGAVSNAVKEAFAAEIPENEIYGMLEFPPDEAMGDLAFPCFKLSRTLKKAPPVIAQELCGRIKADMISGAEAAGLTLASVQDDSPFFYPQTTKEVYNWYNTGFRGLQTIRKGISSSLNIVAVRTLQQIGASLGYLT